MMKQISKYLNYLELLIHNVYKFGLLYLFILIPINS